MLLRLRRFAKVLGRDAAILWFACRNPATPPAIKVAAALLVFYVVSPIDLVPDWLPLVGWLDDVGIVAFALTAILRMIPEPVMRDANAAAGQRLSRWAFWR